VKALRSPAVFVGLLALLVVLAAIVFIRGSDLRIASEPPLASKLDAGTSKEAGAGSTEVGDESHEEGASRAGGTPVIRWGIIAQVTGQAQAGKLISRADAERFLQTKGMTALNLLAAATATGDEEFTRRAAALFPDHPAVQLSVLAKSKDLPAVERAEWIARFRAAAPDSPLPYLYAAHNAFQQNDPAAGLAAASEAIEKPGLYFWSSEFADAGQQLYEFKGYSPLEAQVLSTYRQSLPHFTDLQKLGDDLVKLHEQAVKRNDTTVADEALRAAYGLGKIFNPRRGLGLLSTSSSASPLRIAR